VPIPTSPPISILLPTETPQPAQFWTAYTNGNEVVALAREGNQLWAATHGGAVCWDVEAHTYRKYTTIEGLVSNNLQAVATDGEGNTWFATYDYGVSVLSADDTWTTHTRRDGLASDVVHTIAIDEQGNKWFGTWGGVTLLPAEGGPWQTYNTLNALVDNDVFAIAFDEQGNRWFGTWGGISALSAEGQWTTYTITHGLAGVTYSPLLLMGRAMYGLHRATAG